MFILDVHPLVEFLTYVQTLLVSTVNLRSENFTSYIISLSTE